MGYVPGKAREMMIYGHGKIRRFKARSFGTPTTTPDTMAAFMVSTRGHYNGDNGMAALAALDHARDYSDTDAKFRFWMDVYEIITLWSFGFKSAMAKEF